MTEENKANEEGATKSSRKKKESSKSISDSVINRSTIKVETHHHHYNVFILGSSILVLSSTTAVKNRLALFKGIIMTVFGLWAFYHVYLGLIEKSDLTGGIISIIGVMSLAGNASVAFMMYKHQHKDINFMSAFICCRNDAFAYTGSFWPDIIIGTAIAIIVCHGGIKIIRMSLNPASAEEDCECC